ncbi:hypothetical protein BD779DRAFT_1547214 [Infundibulicybe gibba]|nr:hypothetical protein BD779DRAFT_1547214 [Infundibulicybe gibba]
MDLPPEIIETIFLKLCHQKPLCSRWRAIALAMPSLWASVRIPSSFPPPYDHFRTWISRSAQFPLSVGFYGSIHPTIFTANIFDLIVPVIQRCVSLRLFLDEPTLKRLLALPPGSLCNLQGISINIAPTGYDAIHFLPHRVICTRVPHGSYINPAEHGLMPAP